MTTCWGQSCLFGLLCVSFPFSFEGWMLGLIVLISDHCLSMYLTLYRDGGHVIHLTCMV